ncbi:DUF2586 domain-containing protein [Victivallis vadensis]|uniref:DUF2586 domain-containing protein n=1 Tax=Victivallis vadensis TaxID=172901 RepID=UPI003D05FD17
MAIGSVTIVKVDGMQGNFNEVERVFLYLGKIADPDRAAEIIPIAGNSDLDQLLGPGESELKTQIAAARQNSRNDRFACYAVGVPEDQDWKEVLYAALDKPADLNIEAVVLCTPLESKLEIQACMSAASEVLARFSKFITVIGCVTGIDKAKETWGAYITRVSALVDGVDGERVCIVPQLHGNDLGCVAGRLCDPAVSIADSPMRVATGALIGLGVADADVEPVDSAGAPLTMTTIEALAGKRFCVAQWYAGYTGVYWADMVTLAPEGSDYNVYENLRVVDYCARRVRSLAIGRIADRRLNSTNQSISANQTYFMRPLREASQSTVLNEVELPAMIQPPEAGDVTISWTSRTEVSIAVSVRPYNCPKKITVYMGLDLSNA